MTPEIVNQVRGNRVKPTYFLYYPNGSLKDSRSHVILKMYVKDQLCALLGTTVRSMEKRIKKIDERSMEMYLKLGREYIDLTDPQQSDIDRLRTITKPKERELK